MTKSFRPWKVDEAWLLPPSVQEFVPEGHPAHLVRDIVAEELDLSAILSTYEELRGYPPYHPAMMVALLLYAYSRGVYSSRRIARGCEERLDFQAVTALNRPDFRTISEFRRRHLAALAELFVQVLALCRRAGLVGLGHVAVDGTKLRANASKHKAMSYARMGPAEAELTAEVEGWLAQAEGADAAEDAALGADRRGDEMPAWMRDKQRRLERIRAAKAELEAEAQAAAAAKSDPGTKADGTPRGRRGRQPKHPPGVPKPSAQRNFTDPESRIMKGRDGFVQAYNAQAAVDATAQVIVAHHLTNNASDQDALGPLLNAVTANTSTTPAEVSADSGYCSEANLADLAERGIRGYVATGRAKHPDGGEDRRRGPLVSAMRLRLRRAGRRSRYRLRKQTAEPVFGQIKQGRGFRQLLLRGLEKVKHEWALICTAHNLTKLARAVAA
jgi:transposase